MKRKSYYVIQTNYGYGWEDESSYEVGTDLKQIEKDAAEYRFMGASTRIITRKAKVEVTVKYKYN